MNFFYVITFLSIIGAILFNIGVCCYFRKKICKNNKKILRYFDAISTTFGILSIFLFLSFLLYLKEILFICFALTVALWGVFLCYCDYLVHNQDTKKRRFIFYNLSNFDKVLLILFLFIFIYMFYLSQSMQSIFLSISIILLFIYVILLKQIKKQNKISRIFSNKYMNLAEISLNGLFYYLCWLAIVLYIISMLINIIYTYFDSYDLDSCLDIGICKEGITFDNCTDETLCMITKENCLKNNNIWIEDIRSCDTRNINH